jgi:tRNA G10  N-methylase Trm11
MTNTVLSRFQVDYHLGDIFADLLIFAARSMVEGGRLVFWIPVNRDHYSDDKLPSHPNLRLVANCEQVHLHFGQYINMYTLYMPK